MTPDEQRQVEQLARQMARDQGWSPDSIVTSPSDKHWRDSAWNELLESAAEQLGFVSDE